MANKIATAILSSDLRTECGDLETNGQLRFYLLPPPRRRTRTPSARPRTVPFHQPLGLRYRHARGVGGAHFPHAFGLVARDH